MIMDIEKQDKFIIENYGIMELETMHKKLNLTKTALVARASKLRREGQPVKRLAKKLNYWTKEEEQFVLNNPDVDGNVIAKKLGRPAQSVYNKRWKLGLTKNKDNIIEREGVFKKDIKVTLGQSYQIKRVKKSVKDWNKFAGKCIHETRNHITIRNKNRAETFLKVDFLINEYEIKEVS